MGKYAVGDFKLRVRRSRTGKGVFACEDIPKGACIAEYTGREVSDDEKGLDRGKFLFWVSKKRTIDGNIPQNRARYINHSCRPNCDAEGPNGRVFIMARRGIKAGEEITYNYGKEYFDQFIKPKGCKCLKCEPNGSPNGKAKPARANGKAKSNRPNGKGMSARANGKAKRRATRA